MVWLNRGNVYFNQQDYDSAPVYFARTQAQSRYNDKKYLQRTININIRSAYWNMAVSHLNTGDSFSAYEILNQCRDKYPHLEQCQEKMHRICRWYTLPGCSE